MIRLRIQEVSDTEYRQLQRRQKLSFKIRFKGVVPVIAAGGISYVVSFLVKCYRESIYDSFYTGAGDIINEQNFTKS